MPSRKNPSGAGTPIQRESSENTSVVKRKALEGAAYKHFVQALVRHADSDGASPDWCTRARSLGKYLITGQRFPASLQLPTAEDKALVRVWASEALKSVGLPERPKTSDTKKRPKKR